MLKVETKENLCDKMAQQWECDAIGYDIAIKAQNAAILRNCAFQLRKEVNSFEEDLENLAHQWECDAITFDRTNNPEKAELLRNCAFQIKGALG